MIFDFTLKFGGFIKEKFFSTKFKKFENIRYISLFKKEGLYKIKIVNNSFYFYKGTVLINTLHNISNNFFLDTLKGAKDYDVKQGIDFVNNYIDQLKQEQTQC